MQAAAARKQAGSFAGEQRALGIIGALPQKLSVLLHCRAESARQCQRAVSEAVNGMPGAARRASSMQRCPCERRYMRLLCVRAPPDASGWSCGQTKCKTSMSFMHCTDSFRGSAPLFPRAAGGTTKPHPCVRGRSWKQAATFAGAQRAPGNIGAPPQPLSTGCLKPLEER